MKANGNGDDKRNVRSTQPSLHTFHVSICAPASPDQEHQQPSQCSDNGGTPGLENRVTRGRKRRHRQNGTKKLDYVISLPRNPIEVHERVHRWTGNGNRRPGLSRGIYIPYVQSLSKSLRSGSESNRVDVRSFHQRSLRKWCKID